MKQEILMYDLRSAMKRKDTLAKGTLQLLKAKVDAHVKETGNLSDKDFYTLVRSELKQLEQTLDFSIKAGREDLVKDTQSKIALLTCYLPAQMSLGEATAFIKENVDINKPMGYNMKNIVSLSDGAIPNQLIAQVLKDVLSVVNGGK